MELCPICKTAVRVNHAGYDKGFQMMDVFCVNPQCSNGKLNTQRLTMPFLRERVPLPAAVDGSKTQMCCDQVIAYITDREYYLPERVESTKTLVGDNLTIVCPVCGKAHAFDVAGKTLMQ